MNPDGTLEIQDKLDLAKAIAQKNERIDKLEKQLAGYRNISSRWMLSVEREAKLREALDVTAVIIQVALKYIKNHEGTKALEYIKAAHTEARAALEVE